jgi:hypothetical protein
MELLKGVHLNVCGYLLSVCEREPKEVQFLPSKRLQSPQCKMTDNDEIAQIRRYR